MVMVVLINTAAVMAVSTERGSILSEVDMRQHFKQVEDLYIEPEAVSRRLGRVDTGSTRTAWCEGRENEWGYVAYLSARYH
jgi:hypothetical protein